MTDKLIVDGKVAVVFCPGYGAGWSTWNTEVSPTNPVIAKAVLDGIRGYELVSIGKREYPDSYAYGLGDDVVVERLDPGTLFHIEEYDGHESLYTMKICTKKTYNWKVA